MSNKNGSLEGWYEIDGSGELAPVKSVVVGRKYYVSPLMLSIDPRKELISDRDNFKIHPLFKADVAQVGVQVALRAAVNPDGDVLAIDGRQRLRTAQELWKEGVEQLGSGNTNLVPVDIIEYSANVSDAIEDQMRINRLRYQDTTRTDMHYAKNFALSGMNPQQIADVFNKYGIKISHTDVRQLLALNEPGMDFLVKHIENGTVSKTKAREYTKAEFRDEKGKFDVAKIKAKVDADIADAVATTPQKPAGNGTGTSLSGKATPPRAKVKGSGMLSKGQVDRVLNTEDKKYVVPTYDKLLMEWITGKRNATETAALDSRLAYLIEAEKVALTKPESKKSKGKKGKGTATATPNAPANPLKDDSGKTAEQW